MNDLEDPSFRAEMGVNCVRSVDCRALLVELGEGSCWLGSAGVGGWIFMVLVRELIRSVFSSQRRLLAGQMYYDSLSNLGGGL